MKKEKGTAALAVTVTLCTLLLLGLMMVTVVLTSATSGILNNASILDPAALLSEEESGAASIQNSIIPAFIGIASEDSRMGISAGDNVIRELYSLLSPCLVHGLRTEPVLMEASDWENAISAYPYVFIQYHVPMPLEFLQATGAEEANQMPVGETTLLVDSLFLQPENSAGEVCLLVKTTDGNVLRYICEPEKQEEYPSMGKLTQWVQNFSNNFYRFTLRTYGLTTEPVFLERIRVQNAALAEGSLAILENNENHMARFLRLLDFNPDKLSRHEESDGTKVLVETHGVLQYRDNRYRYTASSEGGVDIGNVIGYKKYYTVYDVIRTACTIAERLRSASQYYLGGEAEVILTACTTAEDTTTLTFSYAFDNLLISGSEPAIVLTVSEDYRILSLQLTAITVTGWGEYRTVYTESGVWDQKTSQNSSIFLTYPLDVYTEAVFPIWTECTVKDKVTGPEEFNS